MTTGGVGANPDGFLPALAANVMGLQEFAATTVEEWEAQLRSGVVTASSFLQAAIHQILGSLADFAEQIPLIGPTIAAIIMGFEGSLEDLGQWFSDLVSVLGNPTGLGTGSPVIGALASIPLLGPIFIYVGQLIDAIVNALGFVGSGFSLVNLQTYVGDLNTAVDGAVGDINDLITGLGGAVIADVVAIINAISTAIQALKNSLAGIFNPAGVGDISLPTLVTNIQTGLQGILPAIVQNANGTASVLSTAAITINNNGTATYNQVAGSVHALVDQANGTMATVSASLQAQAQAAIAQAGSNLTAVAANTQTILNSLFGAFGVGIGAASPASTPAQATSAVVSAQQQLLDNAAGLAALNALLTQAQNGGGLSVSVNFASYANGAIPGIFTTATNLTPIGASAAGPPAIAGGYAVDSGGNGGYSALYNVATTTTDQQIISGVFSGVSGSNYAILLGRVNSAGTSFVYALADPLSGWWLLGAVVAGSSAALDFASDTFSPGAVYSLQCGTGAVGNRVFRILKNGNPLTFSGGSTSFSEVGTTSQLGASYRGGGFGVVDTAKCSTWTMVDNTPPAAVGSGFRAYRTSTGTLGTGSPSLSPNSFYDTVEFNTADLTYASATANKLTVTVSGWYAVEVSFTFTALFSGAGLYFGPSVFKNGTVYATGPTISTGYGASHTYIMYCAAGDYLQPGFYTNFSGGAYIYGANDGLKTFWSVAFMNRGTLS